MWVRLVLDRAAGWRAGDRVPPAAVEVMTRLDRDQVVDVAAAAVGLLVTVAATHERVTGRDRLDDVRRSWNPDGAASGGPSAS